VSVAYVWGELRRRHVVRLAIIYVVVGWVVIQAADVIMPALSVPEWGVSLVVVLVLLGFPVALVLSWMFDVTPDGVQRAESYRTPKAASRAVDTDAPRSIAVLPFVNMSDDRDNEYFSDGMTEEILNALAKVPDLRVASRTSSFAFKGQDSDVLEIARALRVGTVVEGSVRKAGNRIRVTAQLISAEDGYHLFSETYDRELEDVFQVQDDIARSIVDALKVELGGGAAEHLVERETRDMDAYNFYLKGRYFYNRDHETDLRRSLDMYREALARDPSYARAEAGVADTWMHLADDWVPPSEAYPQAREAARRALAIDDTIAEAHAALGAVLGWYDWEFNEAELALRRAVAANPRYADAHWGLATILPCTGRLPEAVDSMRRAVDLDPVSTTFSYYLARFLLFSGHLDEALEESERSVALDPGSFRPLLIVGQAHLVGGRPEEALATFEHAAEVSSAQSVNSYTARALAAAGRTDEARELLEGLAEGDGYVRSEFMAGAWAAAGETDRAFRSLEQAYEDRSAGLIYLHVDPAYTPLRDDARWTDIVDRIGLQ
jgi:adenylate cyclase